MGKGSQRVGQGFLALALIFAAARPAPAQAPPAQGGVGITPAKIQKDLPGRTISEHVLVFNNGADPQRINVSITGLGHDLDGAPEFFGQSASPLSADATQFVLGPNERKDVTVTGNIPQSERSLYAAVVAEFAPLAQPPGQIETHSRVASLLLFRGPKPWSERVQIIDVQVLPGRGGPARVTAAVKNTGDVHVKPHGTAQIVKDGTVLTTVRLGEQLIIPGFARRIEGKWTPSKALTGAITIHVRTVNPSASFTREIDLGGGVESRPQAEITNLRGSDAKGGHVALTVRNIGTVPVAPAVSLFARAGGIERGHVVLPQEELKPGASVDVAWDPGLGDGVYLVTAQLKNGLDLLDEDTTDLRVGSAVTGGGSHPAGRAPAIGFASVLLLLVLGLLIVLVWRRRDDHDEHRGGTPEHAGPVREPAGVS